MGDDSEDSFLVYFDTRTSNGFYNYDTHWNLTDPRFQMLRDFKVTLRSIEFANAVYPTNEFNNVVSFTPDGVTALTVHLVPSIYTGTTFVQSLAALMQTALRAYNNPLYATETVTGTYNSLTYKMTITSSVNIQFVLANNSAYESMGFNESTFNTAHTSWSSAYPIQISGTHYVDIITNLSTQSYNDRNSGHCLCRVPMTSGFGTLISYQNDFRDVNTVSNAYMDRLVLKLFDDHGNPYKLHDNAHVSFVLSFENAMDHFNTGDQYT
jgi:hypothetical protein